MATITKAKLIRIRELRIHLEQKIASIKLRSLELNRQEYRERDNQEILRIEQQLHNLQQ